MKYYQKLLTTMTAFIGLNCDNEVYSPPPSLEGIVKEEFGDAARIVESSGAMFGNESVKLGRKEYGLVLESEGKTYNITVYNDNNKPIVALAKAIEPGDRILISGKADQWTITKVDSDGIGYTHSRLVHIIEKAKK